MSDLSPSAGNYALAQALSEALPSDRPGLFHPYVTPCVHDAPGNTPARKLERLAAHLACEPSLILVGEAPGYQGCRTSGVAFTSERLLMEGAIPRILQEPARLSTRRLPFSEPSATIVWRVLYELGLAEHVVLWNAVQLHPHRGDPWTNRTPTDAELELGRDAIGLLVEAFPAAQVIAIGRKAEATLQGMGITVAGAVRHPANGGATKFRGGLRALALA